MSTHKHFDKLCYAVLAVTLIITVLFMNGKNLGLSVITNEESENDMFTDNDLNSDWSTSDVQSIILSDEDNRVDGNGAYTLDGDIYIINSGKYIISGELSNGSIIINADSNDKIWLMLNGVSITCDDDAAIRVEQADKVFLTLADSTKNTVSTGSQYNEDIISSGVDGAIYSRDDLTINGNGSLNVAAEYMHGIVCNDDLVITGGTVTVDAVQDGIHANDSVRITNADINISAGDDGITVSNDDETAFLYIESGNINISSCYEGFEAIDITIDGGTINIYAEDDGVNANGSSNNSVINITGGNITILNSDGKDADGLDSNKDIYISGGNIFISITGNGSNSAIDCGTENGGICEISGGTVIACGSSGMAEGFDSSSEQGFIMRTASAQAETTVALKDSNGNELISSEIPYSFSSIILSTPEMNVGDTCTLVIGETEEKITIDNTTVSSNFNKSGIPNKNAISDNSQTQESFDNQNNAMPNSPTLTDEQNDSETEMKNGGFSNDKAKPPEIQSGESDSSPPDFSQKDDNANRQQNEQNNDSTDKNFPDFVHENDFASDEEETGLSKENIIYLSISAAILIIGCITAFLVKGKTE